MIFLGLKASPGYFVGGSTSLEKLWSSSSCTKARNLWDTAGLLPMGINQEKYLVPFVKTQGELWNHGMAWDGRDLRAHPAPSLLWAQLPLQTLSKLALRTFLCPCRAPRFWLCLCKVTAPLKKNSLKAKKINSGKCHEKDLF